MHNIQLIRLLFSAAALAFVPFSPYWYALQAVRLLYFTWSAAPHITLIRYVHLLAITLHTPENAPFFYFTDMLDVAVEGATVLRVTPDKLEAIGVAWMVIRCIYPLTMVGFGTDLFTALSYVVVMISSVIILPMIVKRNK